MSKNDMVCKCKHIKKSDVMKAVQNGADTYKKVKERTGAGSKCGHCKDKVKRCIKECQHELKEQSHTAQLGEKNHAPQAATPAAAPAAAATPAAAAAPAAPAEQRVLRNRVYRHFKGNYYLVEDIATHSETGEKYVVYRKLYGEGDLWVRPLDLFCSKVDKEKYPEAAQEFRFELQDGMPDHE
jgi:bacterioferritin-associated ferredoxin